MAIFNIDFPALAANILPPAWRLSNFLSWTADLLVPQSWAEGNFATDYISGNATLVPGITTYPLWTSTSSFNRGDRCISWYPNDTNIAYLLSNGYVFGTALSNKTYECSADPIFEGNGLIWPTRCIPQQDQGQGASLSPVILGGVVTNIGIGSGGTGYGPAALINFIGGGGTGCQCVPNYDGNNFTAHCTTAGGLVTGVVVTASTNPTPYIVPPTVTVVDASGGGSQIVATLTATGLLAGFTIVNPGSGHSAVPRVFISGGLTVGPGSITSVTIVWGGSGYTEAPQALMGTQWMEVADTFVGADQRAKYNGDLGTLTWVLNENFHTTFRDFASPIGLYGWGGTTNPATFFISTTGGSITGVIVTHGGSGYEEQPELVVADPSGSGAQLYATLTNGSITAVTIVAGGAGYNNPQIEIIEGGVFPDQQAHSDIWISTNGEIGDAFYAGGLDDEGSWAIGSEFDPSVPFIQYVQGDDGDITWDFTIWVPTVVYNYINALVPASAAFQTWSVDITAGQRPEPGDPFTTTGGATGFIISAEGPIGDVEQLLLNVVTGTLNTGDVLTDTITGWTGHLFENVSSIQHGAAFRSVADRYVPAGLLYRCLPY